MKEIINLTGYGDRNIPLRVWSGQGAPSHVIVISHGMGEHIDRYEPFARFLEEQGMTVLGANHRGHGQDAPLPGHFGA